MNGDYALEDTVYLPFTTRALTGIPTALVSGEVQIYEDASVTQITAAETLAVSLDSIVGFNMCSVAATAANGFELGKSYTAILSAGTVDSVSAIGEVVGQFTIGASAAAVDLANGTDGLGALLAACATATGFGTAAELAKVPKSDGTSSWNATALAAINAEVDTGLSDYDAATGTEVAALNNLSAADVNAEVDAAIETYHLDHLFAVDYDPASKPGIGTALMNELVENDGGVSRFTTNALETAPGGTSTSTLMQSTTITGLVSQTEFNLTAGSADDDAYNGQMAVITDQATGTQKAVVLIVDYDGGNKTVTLDVAPAFTIANTDTINIFAVSGSAIPLQIDANGRVDLGSVGGTAQSSGDVVALLTTLDTVADGIQTDLSNGTDGLGALAALLTTLDTVADGIQADLSNGTDGLGALAALITTLDTVADGIQTDLSNGTDGLGALAALITTLDTVADAIKVVTDKFVFTVANQVDSNTLSFNDAEIVGDGNATPWDGA